MKTKQQKLNEACKKASHDGVGFAGAINKDGTVSLRRDEIYTPSHVTVYESLETALARLNRESD